MQNSDEINETTHVLQTPEIVGTDEEKVGVLHMWADLIGMVRNINTSVVSYENKKSILVQIKKELELIELELDNAKSDPTDINGATALEQLPKEKEEEAKLAVPAPDAPPTPVTLVPNAQAAPEGISMAPVTMPSTEQPSFMRPALTQEENLAKLKSMAGVEKQVVKTKFGRLLMLGPRIPEKILSPEDNTAKIKRLAGA